MSSPEHYITNSASGDFQLQPSTFEHHDGHVDHFGDFQHYD
jgi:hypothetical protein